MSEKTKTASELNENDLDKLRTFHSLFKKFKEDMKNIPNYETTMTYKYVIPLFEMLMDECRTNTREVFKLT